MELALGIVVGLVVLVLLVAVHEFGHAYMALRKGVKVEEFGIGFPPRAWGKKLKNGMLFTLNWLPLGGFVKLQGEYDAADKKGDYGAATYWQKTQILLAGVLVNWLVAAVLLTMLAWIGLPKLLDNQFYVPSDTSVTTYPVTVLDTVDGSPAEKVGLEKGDRILTFAEEEVSSPNQLVVLARSHQDETVQLTYERDGREYAGDVQLNSDEEAAESGYLGATPSGQAPTIKAGWSAPIVGVVNTAQFSWETLVGVKDLAVNTAVGLVQRISPDANTREQAQENLSESAANVAGPIGILAVIFPAATEAGFVNLLFLTAIISLTLAVMNILPIPALDGGRWTIMTIFRLLNKPLTKEREEGIQGIGFLVLMVLIIVITFADIGKLF